MSRPWIAFYHGDYLKDTGQLTTEQHGAYFLLLCHCWQHGSIPLADEQRAAITRLPLARWRKIKDTINSYFQDDGTNKRATKEIEKAEVVGLKRAMAGRKGGIQSGIAKAIAMGERSKRESKFKANAIAGLQQTPKQTGEQKPSNCEAISQSKIITSENNSAREEPAEIPQVQDNSARLLATALPTGALARSPSPEKAEKPLAAGKSYQPCSASFRLPGEPRKAESGIPEFLRRNPNR